MKRSWRKNLILILLVALFVSGGRAIQAQKPAQNPAQNAELVAPRIILTTPAQREIVEPTSAIKLIFDQPMERTSVEAAFSIDPKIDGAFAWSDDNIGSTLIFTPAAPLKRGQEYKIAVGTGAKSKVGAALEPPYKL